MTEHRIDLKSLETIRDGSGHSIFGASGSAMFLNCPGSLIPNLLAEDNAGEDAAYGTVAHDLGEQWRRSGIKPVDQIGRQRFVQSGEWGYVILVDEVMLDYVEQSVRWSSLLPGDHLAEVRVDYSTLTPIPKQGGTLDFAAMRYGHGVIQDEKYGKNDQVHAEWNSQLMLYAYGIWLEWDWLYGFKEFSLRISQPRLDHFDEWTIKVCDLLEWTEWAKKQMHIAWSHDAPRVPGVKQCRWCKVRGTCAANAKMQADLVSDAFADLHGYTVEDIEQFKAELDIGMVKRTIEVMTLSTEDMVNLMKYRKVNEAFWKSLELELHRRAIKEGEKIPEMKLVEGRSFRHFVNPNIAARKLISLGCSPDDVEKKVVCSPAEAEVLLKKAGHKHRDLPELLKPLVRKPRGKPTLAWVTDKRPELTDPADDAFADLVESDETVETE